MAEAERTIADGGSITVSLPPHHARAIADGRDVSDLACNAFRVALGLVDPVPSTFRTTTLITAEVLLEEVAELDRLGDEARAEETAARTKRAEEGWCNRAIALREARDRLAALADS